MVLVVILFLVWIPSRAIFSRFDEAFNDTASGQLTGASAIAASGNARSMSNGASNMVLYGFGIVLIIVGLLYAQSRERYTGVYQ